MRPGRSYRRPPPRTRRSAAMSRARSAPPCRWDILGGTTLARHFAGAFAASGATPACVHGITALPREGDNCAKSPLPNKPAQPSKRLLSTTSHMLEHLFRQSRQAHLVRGVSSHFRAGIEKVDQRRMIDAMASFALSWRNVFPCHVKGPARCGELSPRAGRNDKASGISVCQGAHRGDPLHIAVMMWRERVRGRLGHCIGPSKAKVAEG